MSETNSNKPRSVLLMALTASGLALALMLLVAEVALRVFEIADPLTRRDPFEGFAGSAPAFYIDDASDRGATYVPSPNMARLQVSFPVEKSERGYRVFTFGGSTTEGVPFSKWGSFSRWLEDDLQALHPERNIEVINLGMSGIGSSRVLQLFSEATRYQPDLFIVYTGQNEFRDAFFHGGHVTRSAWATTLLSWLYSSRVIYLISEGSVIAWRTVFGAPQISYGGRLVDNVLSEPFSPDAFSAWDYYAVPRLSVHAESTTDRTVFARLKQAVKSLVGRGASVPPERVFENYEANVRRMAEIARQNNVGLIFLQKAQNPKTYNRLADKEYGVAERPPVELREAWQAMYQSAVQAMSDGECSQAEGAFERALQSVAPVSDRHTPLYKGICFERRGDWAQARAAYTSRFLPNHLELNKRLRILAAELKLPLLDVFAEFEAAAEHGIVGYENFFVDNAHMTLAGYALIADRLARLIATGDMGLQERSGGDTVDSAERAGEFERLAASAEALTALAWSAFNQGDSDRALALAKNSLAVDPDGIQARLLLGYVYVDLGRTDAARVEWEQLRDIYAEL